MSATDPAASFAKASLVGLNMTGTKPAGANLVDLNEEDVPEIAAFVAAQSGRAPDATLSHLRWLLLENPARQSALPLGCGVRASSGGLVGCILYLPQMFTLHQNPVLLLGSSCFYVDESHRGSGGALFLKFTRAAARWPLFGNSANAIAAQLWKARGASPIPCSDHELVGVIDWPPVVEEFALRRGAGTSAARVAGAAASWFRGVRKLRLPLDHTGDLVQLSSVAEAAELTLPPPADNLSARLTAKRDESYLRWRYFSQRDPSIALFAFRNGNAQPATFVAVNERPRGHRGQIRSLNVLDIFPKPAPDALATIAASLYEKYRDRAHVITLRCLDTPLQNALLKAGFHRRAFESPNGWLLDRGSLLSTRDYYFVPADGDWII